MLEALVTALVSTTLSLCYEAKTAILLLKREEALELEQSEKLISLEAEERLSYQIEYLRYQSGPKGPHAFRRAKVKVSI
jgi:hypothetical protein